MQALARYEGALAAVHIRVAGGAGCYWVDLCQPGNSRAVQIDAQGWRIVQHAPVVFVRSESMQPMPDPVHGSSIDALWSIANVPQPMRPLVLAWLLECLRPDTPFPGLELVGPMQNFGGFADPAKLVLIFDMLAGRLEIFPMLVLFLPDTWRKF